MFGEESCRNNGVVIAFDARHNSKGFAHISAAVFKHYGIKCLLFENYACTPMVPYSIIKYNCLAGIMVTASHNPKQDNGYKVYWSNGAQIIEPHDRGIREHIHENLVLLDLSEHYDYNAQILKNPPEALLEKTMSMYMDDSMKRIQKNPVELNSKCKPFVYTAMHGVGYAFVKALFQKFGFKEAIPVKEQVYPDPEFSTVVYPNPEEGEGSLNLSFKTAKEFDSSLVLANDPDADRLAMAEKQKE